MNGGYKIDCFLMYIECYERNKVLKNVKFDKTRIYVPRTGKFMKIKGHAALFLSLT